MDPDDSILEPPPSVFNYVLSFLLVGVAWGFTTPFIRRAAADFNARQEAQAQQQSHPGPEEEEREREREQVEEEEVPLQTRTRTRQKARQGEDTKDEDDIEIENENDNDENEDQDEDEDEDQPPTSAIPPTTTTPAWMKPSSSSWLKQKITTLFWTVFNLLRTPAYSIPLVINLTGSIWFFLLVGKHGMFFFVVPNPMPRGEETNECYRTIPNGPAVQLECIPLHGSWGVVRGAEDDC